MNTKYIDNGWFVVRNQRWLCAKYSFWTRWKGKDQIERDKGKYDHFADDMGVNSRWPCIFRRVLSLCALQTQKHFGQSETLSSLFLSLSFFSCGSHSRKDMGVWMAMTLLDACIWDCSSVEEPSLQCHQCKVVLSWRLLMQTARTRQWLLTAKSAECCLYRKVWAILHNHLPPFRRKDVSMSWWLTHGGAQMEGRLYVCQLFVG